MAFVLLCVRPTIASDTITISNFLLELGSTATAYEPYSNICPITGWTGVNGWRTGVNVWDEEWEVGGISNINGKNITDTNVIRTKNFVSVLPNTQYYIGCQRQLTGWVRQRFYDADKNYIGYTGQVIDNGVFTTASNCYYMRFVTYASSGYGTTYNHDISINYPATDTEYHAYQGASIPITFPTEAGIVYGGEVDVVNGKLTVDRAEVDLGDLSYSAYGASDTYDRYISSTLDNIVKEYGRCICESFKTRLLSESTNANEIWISGGTSKLSVTVSKNRYASPAEFKSAMQGVRFVYEIATPIEYDITPQQVQMLLGNNNVWCDTGDTSVTYKVDLQTYIQKLIDGAGGTV